MDTSLLGRFALSASAAVACLAGCAGPQVQGPIAAVPLSQNIHASMQSQAKSGTLLYVSWAGGVNVYTYPSGQIVTTLTGFESPAGLCSDKAGNVFVDDTMGSVVYEFAHGGTQPIATLVSYTDAFTPIGCTVDPTTNNLAVTNDGTNQVFVFQNESGTPEMYNNPYALGYYGCTYDGSGNLFMRGTTSHIAELPKGSSTFENLKLSGNIQDLVGFAWDGKYLSIDSNNPSNVNYRVRVKGTKATIVRKASLGGAEFVFQFTIYNNQLIGPDEEAGKVSFWKYPNIGNPVKQIALELPVGTAISLPR